MKYVQLFLLFVTFSFTISCNNSQPKQITNSKDYNAYLNVTENKPLENAEKEVTFWENKLQKTPEHNNTQRQHVSVWFEQ